MKKFFRYGLIGLVSLVILGVGGMYVFTVVRRATPAEDTIAALASDAQVAVEQERWLVFRPTSGVPAVGVILYPGGLCDIRGYAPVLRRIAAAGYLVVALPMPFGLASFSPDKALTVPGEFPEVKQWVLIGHSLGGSAAATFVRAHPDAMAGLVAWDAYPKDSASLADYPRPVWLIHRATAEGAPPDYYTQRRHLFPKESTWIPIKGGIHMYFGSFVGGGFKETWPPSISRESQQDQVVQGTLAAIRAMTRS